MLKLPILKLPSLKKLPETWELIAKTGSLPKDNFPGSTSLLFQSDKGNFKLVTMPGTLETPFEEMFHWMELTGQISFTFTHNGKKYITVEQPDSLLNLPIRPPRHESNEGNPPTKKT